MVATPLPVELEDAVSATGNPCENQDRLYLQNTTKWSPIGKNQQTAIPAQSVIWRIVFSSIQWR